MTIDSAVQSLRVRARGGSAQGKIGVGVFKVLAEDDSVRMTHGVGSSAGALNLCAFACGMVEAAHEGPRRYTASRPHPAVARLDRLWQRVEETAERTAPLRGWLDLHGQLQNGVATQIDRLQSLTADLFGLGGMYKTLAHYGMRAVDAPYQLQAAQWNLNSMLAAQNPVLERQLNPLLPILEEEFHNAAALLAAPGAPQVAINATVASNLSERIFRNGEITARRIAASAALAPLFPLVDGLADGVQSGFNAPFHALGETSPGDRSPIVDIVPRKEEEYKVWSQHRTGDPRLQALIDCFLDGIDHPEPPPSGVPIHRITLDTTKHVAFANSHFPHAAVLQDYEAQGRQQLRQLLDEGALRPATAQTALPDTRAPAPA